MEGLPLPKQVVLVLSTNSKPAQLDALRSFNFANDFDEVIVQRLETDTHMHPGMWEHVDAGHSVARKAHMKLVMDQRSVTFPVSVLFHALAHARAQGREETKRSLLQNNT